MSKYTCVACGYSTDKEIENVRCPKCGYKGLTDQPLPDEELGQILQNLLGEYHDHKCPSDCGTGCINCRNTGYNQTPCLICDKDGIAFKNIREAKSALQAYTNRAKAAAAIEARIDMLEHFDSIAPSEVNDRLAEQRTALSKISKEYLGGDRDD